MTGPGRGLLAPRSVAIVGASDVAASPGRQAVENLVRHGYSGQVWPVNPRYRSVADQPCYPSLRDLPGRPDAVFVLIGAAGVPAVAASAVDLGARLLVVASSGLGEGGDPKGQALAQEIRAAIAGTATRLLGPNTEGMWSVSERCFITFGSALRLMPPVRAGNVAVISQSGSIGAALGWRLTAAGIGLSYVTMTGNELDLDALELGELALADPSTSVIAMFLEGLRDGRRLIDLGAAAAAAGKRIVVLKAGRSRRAKLATQSHTGKVASDSAIYEAAFEQANVVSVARIQDLVRAAAALAITPVQPTKGIGVVAVSGGCRAIVADAAAEYGCPLPDFAPATEETLSTAIRDFSSTRNPCDVGGWSFSTEQTAQTLLQPILADPNTDSVLIQFASRGREESITALHALQALRADYPPKPTVLSLLTDGPAAEARSLAAELGVHLCDDPTVAVQTLAFLYGHRRATGDAHDGTDGVSGPFESLPKSHALGWDEASRQLQDCGVTVEQGVVVCSADDAVAAAATLGAAACVLKLHPDDAPHKTDVGGVFVGLRTADEVAMAFRRLAASPVFSGRAILQRDVPAVAEALVALVRDPDFGPVLCVGPGGVDVETHGVRAFGVLPLDRGQIRAIVARSGALAAGRRPGRENDFDALVELIHRLPEAFTDEICTIELNPVLVGAPGSGAHVVDILIEAADHGEERVHD